MWSHAILEVWPEGISVSKLIGGLSYDHITLSNDRPPMMWTNLIP